MDPRTSLDTKVTTLTPGIKPGPSSSQPSTLLLESHLAHIFRFLALTLEALAYVVLKIKKKEEKEEKEKKRRKRKIEKNEFKSFYMHFKMKIIHNVYIKTPSTICRAVLKLGYLLNCSKFR